MNRDRELEMRLRGCPDISEEDMEYCVLKATSFGKEAYESRFENVSARLVAKGFIKVKPHWDHSENEYYLSLKGKMLLFGMELVGGYSLDNFASESAYAA